MKRASIKAAIFVASFAAAATAAAQAWPNRAVRLIVPWPPAGTTDIIVRPLAQKLTENLGQQFVVDNRGGANGLIGTEMTAKAPADGYTFLFTTLASFAQNTSYYRKLGYDPNSFVLLGQVGWTPIMMLAHPSLPVKNARDVIALAKARPGELVYGSFGQGQQRALRRRTARARNEDEYGSRAVQGRRPGSRGQHRRRSADTLWRRAAHDPVCQVRPAEGARGDGGEAHRLSARVPTIAEALKIRDYDITVTFGMLAQAGAPGGSWTGCMPRSPRSCNRRTSSHAFPRWEQMRRRRCRRRSSPIGSSETARWRGFVEATGIRAE